MIATAEIEPDRLFLEGRPIVSNLGEIHIRLVAAINDEMISRFEGRFKKRQSLDMVPVKVA